MSWWLIVHLVVSGVLFGFFVVRTDDAEPLLFRIFIAALVALFWLPALVFLLLEWAREAVSEWLEGLPK